MPLDPAAPGDAALLTQLLALASLRPLVALSLLPLFGRRTLPLFARGALTLSLTLPLLPLLAADAPDAALVPAEFVALLLKEALLGLLFGTLLLLPLWAAAAAGALLDTQRGAALAALFNPLADAETTPLAALLTVVVTAFLFASGGFLLLLEALYQSYLSWPPLAYWPRVDADAAALFLGQLDWLLYLALFVAAPALALMFVAELGLALIGRLVPQLNVFVLAMPVKSALALALLGGYFAALIALFDDELQRFLVRLSLLERALR